MTLQLLGVGTVIWGISETRALFGLPSLASKAREWLKRFPLFRRAHVVSAEATMSFGTSGVQARGHVLHRAENTTIESRVSSLERNLELTHNRITQLEKELDTKFRDSLQSIEQEKGVRQAEDHAISEKLLATSTGGIHISAMGAAWIFVGLVLGSASVEIARIIK